MRPPRTSGGADAREWVWGPETGEEASVGGERVRLWVRAERARTPSAQLILLSDWASPGHIYHISGSMAVAD